MKNMTTLTNQTGWKAHIISYFKVQAIPLTVLLLMIVVASILSPVFFSKINFENLVVQVAHTIVVSMGMFICILTGGIDLSVGSAIALSGVLAAGFMRTMPVWIALLLSTLVCTMVGVLTGVIISYLRIDLIDLF